jgi:hypothetical protein
LPRRKEHKFNFGKGGAMLGLTFQSVKDGFLADCHSSILDQRPGESDDGVVFRGAFQSDSLLFVEACGLS